MQANEKRRLKWRCRRGMKELDVLLEHYINHGYDGASSAEQAAFADLLELPDPLLLDYLTGRSTPAEPNSATVVAHIRERRRTPS